MRATVYALLVLLASAPASALGSCQQGDGLTVCWNDSGDTLVSAGGVAVGTYTSERAGDGSGDYEVVRDGVRANATAGGTRTEAEAHRADYRYQSGDRQVHAQEVRVSAGGEDAAAGARRSTYGAAVVCEVYAEDVAHAIPCTPLTP